MKKKVQRTSIKIKIISSLVYQHWRSRRHTSPSEELWINEYSSCSSFNLLWSGVRRILTWRILARRILSRRVLSASILTGWVLRSGVLPRWVLPRWVLSRRISSVPCRSRVGVVPAVRWHTVRHVVGRCVSSNCNEHRSRTGHVKS